MDTAAKTAKTVRLNAAKTPSRIIMQKMAEETDNLVGNKEVDKINSAGLPKGKGKEEDY